MKRLAAIVLTSAMATTAVVGQGMVDFRNRIPGQLDAPVFDADGVTRLAGDRFWAQLYYATSASGTFTAAGGRCAFQTGAQAGYWEPSQVALPGAMPGQTVFVKVVVFSVTPWIGDVQQRITHEESKVLSVKLTGAAVTLAGLESFSIRPESLQVSRDSGQVVIKWTNLGATGYTLQSSPSLGASATWTEVIRVAASDVYVGYEFSVANSVSGPSRFYRLQRWP